jgi:sigma-E factor negative regulatory protein RseC
MYEIGVVKSINGISAKVFIGRSGGCCDSCEKPACDIPENGVETDAVNIAGAQIGQRVKVVMKPRTYMKGALLLFVLPIVALITGIIAGEMYLTRIVAGIDPELLAASGGFTALFLSFFLIKGLAKRMEKKTDNRSVIDAIIE